MSVERKRLVSVTALPTGWRAIFPFDSGAEDLSELADGELFSVMPVAALATVEVWDAPHGDHEPAGPWDENVEAYVQPLVAVEGVYLDWREDQDHVALLAPGEEVGAGMRAVVIDQIKRERDRQQRRSEARRAEAA